MLREIIKIDEDKCDGCGKCVPACHEGALQIIEGKARLISDLFCDGLGACIGECPQNAITIEKREAEVYDEIKVMQTMITKPNSVINAHLKHLYEHNELDLLNQAIDFIKASGKPINLDYKAEKIQHSGCPGSKMIDLNVVKPSAPKTISVSEQESMLSQWPIQLHLVNPMASYFKNKELVIMSTCGPLASANVHLDYLKNRAVVVACPKLDYTDPYTDKLQAIFDIGVTPKAIVVRMEVPCCGGLSQMALSAALNSQSKMVLEEHTLSITGDLLNKKVLINKEF